ncbi:MAG: hypothetical protein ACYC27_03230 [Armatimonadota bacterium]
MNSETINLILAILLPIVGWLVREFLPKIKLPSKLEQLIRNPAVMAKIAEIVGTAMSWPDKTEDQKRAEVRKIAKIELEKTIGEIIPDNELNALIEIALNLIKRRQ